jgi:hypothetical protein
MKIDVSTIEGYADMTAEEKLKALESFEVPEPDYTGYVKKEVFDRTASEAAGYKKQLRETQSAEEVAKQEAAERMQEMEARLKQYETDKQVSDYKASLLGLGYDAKLAETTAKAMANGDMATVFKSHATHIASMEQAIKSELMSSTPKPPAGDGTKQVTKQDLAGMSLAEKQAFATEHPTEYKAIYEGGN